jgi:hypothetical protein
MPGGTGSVCPRATRAFALWFGPRKNAAPAYGIIGGSISAGNAYPSPSIPPLNLSPSRFETARSYGKVIGCVCGRKIGREDLASFTANVRGWKRPRLVTSSPFSTDALPTGNSCALTSRAAITGAGNPIRTFGADSPFNSTILMITSSGSSSALFSARTRTRLLSTRRIEKVFPKRPGCFELSNAIRG